MEEELVLIIAIVIVVYVLPVLATCALIHWTIHRKDEDDE